MDDCGLGIWIRVVPNMISQRGNEVHDGVIAVQQKSVSE